MSIEAQIDRHLLGIEQAERLFEATCAWVLADLHEDYFDEDEADELKRLVYDGASTPWEENLWDTAEAFYLESCSPY